MARARSWWERAWEVIESPWADIVLGVALVWGVRREADGFAEQFGVVSLLLCGACLIALGGYKRGRRGALRECEADEAEVE